MSYTLTLKDVPPSEAVIDTVAQLSNGKVLLAFSTGKDSIAAWLALKERGVEGIPYYYYLVPDLQIVEASLKYYEDFFGTHIYRVPSPSLYRMWRNCIFQNPERLPVLMSTPLPNLKHEHLADAVKQTHKVSKDTWTALGVRAADSVNRRTNFVRSGAMNKKALKFYPVWDWKKERLRIAIFKAKVKLPIDYWLFGRTLDGLDYRFIAPLKKHYPDDYERIRQYFPMIDAELLRGEMNGMSDHL